MSTTQFLEGPAGTGKTTYALGYLRKLLDENVPPESILVLVPQRALGLPYQAAFAGPDWPSGAPIDVLTLGGLARRGLELFWPLIAELGGFAQPHVEPTFLTIETAQYYMARFVREEIRTGVFDGVNITPFEIMRQTLDNLSKAAVNGFSLDEAAERLITAWGDRHSSRPPAYRASIDLARRFRTHCLAHNLLDFSLQAELYMTHLLQQQLYREYFTDMYRHLVADNLEESFPIVADFIRWLWDDIESALLIYDNDGGYRIFLGADPDGMHQLRNLCQVKHDASNFLPDSKRSPQLMTLAQAFSNVIPHTTSQGSSSSLEDTISDDQAPLAAFVHHEMRFYPQMIDWVVGEIVDLVKSGVSPREIVVLAPFLSDSLRFALTTRLAERDIETMSHRPSRAVRDESAARTILTFMALAHPDWDYRPPPLDVSDALQHAITDLDPVRSWLLAQIVYGSNRDELGSFDAIQSAMQERITYRAGERYESLRSWLQTYREQDYGRIPPDHFISRLFGEVLSQPGYGFHTDLDAGRVVAQLVESARKFRQTLYPDGLEDWLGVGREYVDLVQQGLLAALYVSSWDQMDRDAVFLSPAYTFLMRNRPVDYQFWLDVGSSFWWERLEQPLTHPYVLARRFPRSQVWTDEMEHTARQTALHRLVIGLVRRCRRRVYAAIADLGEQGYEQRGPLLKIVHQLIRRYGTVTETHL